MKQKNVVCLVVLAIGMMLLSQVCWAGEELPNLKGTWKGESQSVGGGKLGHAAPSETGKFLSVKFTIEVKEQKGRNFFGVRKSDKRSESMVGVIGGDNQSVYMADEDGYMVGKLVSPQRMEVIYLEAQKTSRVASYTVFDKVN